MGLEKRRKKRERRFPPIHTLGKIIVHMCASDLCPYAFMSLFLTGAQKFVFNNIN